MHWGRHPGEIDELAKGARAEHERRVAQGERNVRHGVPGLGMPLWKKALAWVAVIVVVSWMAFACVRVLNAPEAEEEQSPVTQPR